MEFEKMLMNANNKKLIIFDVDGVIFNSQFLLHLSLKSSIFNYLKALYLCFLFSINCLNMRDLLERVYIDIKGLKEDDIWQVYNNMKMVKYANETISKITQKGHYVSLISSGVPDILVKDLASRLDAGCGHGIDVTINNGIYTGEIGGQLSFHEGKVRVVEKLLEVHNTTWDDVVVVGDDRNNLDIMELAKVSIGFNSYYPVRKKVKYLIDSNDLRDVLEYVFNEDEITFDKLSLGFKHEIALSWSQEFRRKGIHACSLLVPIFSGVNYVLTLIMLIAMTVLYSASEWARLNGFRFPVLSFITKQCVRSSERRRFAFAPITLASGVVLSLLFFSPIVASVTIAILACADSMATIVGKFYGTVRIPYNPKKSIEGTVAFFITAFICAFIYLPLKTALIVSLVSCIIESLPVEFDNITVPLGAGMVLGLLI
ncbi:dolichol kinase [Candidatus Scalindua japonica]|uniref:Dolichol kinase n=1 Tax=Candidatus Scalindua japonica TaxID=1284222 RepID=A0A286TV64_9BACT|nr:HAD-IB family phosphatase [Candidatus Scalindua japonica]GAX59744.1 dolichol kinase [Candidatus Scalindua japonica]